MWGFYSEHHQISDPVFEDGASYDNVWWRRRGSSSHYSTAWTLEVEGEAGVELIIEDVQGDEVYQSALDDDGQASVPLKAVTIRPEGWQDGGEINDSRSVDKIEHTPHQVSVDGVTEEVEMVEPMEWAF